MATRETPPPLGGDGNDETNPHQAAPVPARRTLEPGLRTPAVTQAVPRARVVPPRAADSKPMAGPVPDLRPPASSPPAPALSAPPRAPRRDETAEPAHAMARPSAPPRGQSGPRAQAPRFYPPQPRSLAETGLTETMAEELILKALFFSGELRGSEIANRICLPTPIVDEVIENLRRQKYLDLKGGGGLGVGKSAMVFTLTSYASDLVKQILERNRYNGPAPVRLEDWFEAVKAQTVRGSRINRARMEEQLSGLVGEDDIYDGLGPALNSGRAVFFYGPPGNGKTAICQRLVRCYDGDIYVPHALLIDDFIIRVFDPTLHKAQPSEPGGPGHDARWVRCARPMVVVGGELTLETLDLIYSPDVKYYEAPFQLKATNGLLLIDDFGRQKVSPRDLLNRWIVPLENDTDYLTLHTGKKLQVPFDCFVAFSTNLDPADLVDDAFLRRVRYKLEVKPPDEQQFHLIFEAECRRKNVAYDADQVQHLIDVHYTGHGRRFAACQPRDLLDQVVDICHYRGIAPKLSPELFALAAKNYFAKFTRDD